MGVTSKRVTEAPRAARPEVDGRRRVVIEGVSPQIGDGRYPAKRVVGDRVGVEADVFADGHDALAGVLRYRKAGEERWREVPLEPIGNDRWRAEFPVPELGRYEYTLEAWVDHFKSWRRDLAKRVEAGQDVAADLQIGAELIEVASRRADGPDGARLLTWADVLRANQGQGATGAVRHALGGEISALMERYPDRARATTYDKVLQIVVDPERARFSSWYEMFPRSASPDPSRPGTLRDVAARLPYVVELGFDVLYLPPIHPIGLTARKGKNNATTPEPGAPGSPWAIGGPEGGHTSIHPDLGTLDDFLFLVRRARELGVDLALDLAFQTSPEHPWVHEHPGWFRHRPDGTIQYAENPPKKYQDIYPLNFETEDWRGLWEALRDVVLFWVDKGVRIFRVDNPHTKPFPFWEWLITEVKARHPEVIFLAEAFTRPKVMFELAKLGFSQSYTYFAWRSTKPELIDYFTRLTKTEVVEYFRPNLWPNTPDILTEYLQYGGRGAFVARLILAATLGASYGIYGPAFELGEHVAVRPGSEEYLDSEKYEVKHWDLDSPHSLRELIARVNRIRTENPALQADRSLIFHPVDNDQMICYSKTTEDGGNPIVVVVNLDPHHTQSGWIDLSFDVLGLEAGRPYQAHDLLTEARFLWHGGRNFVQLDPHSVPAHIFRINRQSRTERDFEYYW